MTHEELEYVTGAFAFPDAALGAAAVAASGQKFTSVQAAYAAGIGAMTGFIGGPVGAQAAANHIGVGTVGGIAAGGAQRLNKQ